MIFVDLSSSTEHTGGTEAVFVGDVADFVDDAVGASVRVASLHDLSLSLGSKVLNVALLIGPDSVGGFVTVGEREMSIRLRLVTRPEASQRRSQFMDHHRCVG